LISGHFSLIRKKHKPNFNENAHGLDVCCSTFFYANSCQEFDNIISFDGQDRENENEGAFALALSLSSSFDIQAKMIKIQALSKKWLLSRRI
jgi:hypothetical protein